MSRTQLPAWTSSPTLLPKLTPLHTDVLRRHMLVDEMMPSEASSVVLVGRYCFWHFMTEDMILEPDLLYFSSLRRGAYF